MVAAALYGVAQVFAVSWPTRSVRAGTVLLALLVGVYACGTAVALLEVGYTRAVADRTGRADSTRQGRGRGWASSCGTTRRTA